MKAQIKIVNIMWEGPLSPEKAYKKKDASDYGVYQFYGDHHVYGLDVLLYIGMASEQTFGKRLSAPDYGGLKYWNQKIQIYLGRICTDAGERLDEDRADMIDRVEKLLLHACFPAFNSQGIKNPPDADKYKKLLILNWGKFRSLLPEVSGYRFTKDDLEESFQPIR